MVNLLSDKANKDVEVRWNSIHIPQPKYLSLQQTNIVSPKNIIRAVTYLLFQRALTSNSHSVINLFHQLNNSGRITDEDINSTSNWFGTGAVLTDYAATCAAIIVASIKRQFDRKYVWDILLAIMDKKDRKQIEQVLKNVKQYTQAEIDNRTKKMFQRMQSDPRFTYSSILAITSLWANRVNSVYFNYAFSTLRSGDIDSVSGVIESSYNFSTAFDKDKNVKMYFKRIRKLMESYVEKYGSRFSSLHGYIESMMQNTADASWRMCIEQSIIPMFVTPNDLDEIIESTIDKCIKNLLITIYDCVRVNKAKKALPSFCGSTNDLDIRTLVVCDQSEVEREIYMINERDIAELICHCVWSTRLALLQKPIELATDSLFSFFLSKSNENVKGIIKKLNETKQDLQKACKENENLSAINSALRSQIEKSNELNFTPRKNSSESDESAKLKRALKDLEKTQKKLEQERAKTAALREKISSITQAKSSSGLVDISKVDVNKRYLFVVEHDGMQTKILEWFPNSIVSNKADVCIRSRDNIYMTIFLTKSISHAQYNLFKSKCIRYGIPFTNCNNVNYRRICEAILECGAAVNNS